MIDLGASSAGGRVVTTARTVGIGLAVALVAASAGFFAGRAWTGSTSAVAGAPAATDVSSATDVSAGTTTTAPLVTALATSPAETASGSPGLVVTADESEAASGETGAAPDGMPPVATAAMVPAPYLPGSYPSPYPYGEASATEPGELLGQRVTAEGTTLRAHLIRDPEGAFGGPVGWSPAGWCYPTGYVVVGVTDATIISVGQGPWFAEPYGQISGSMFVAGLVEGKPMTVLIAQVAEGVSNVTLHGTAGSDASAPIGGGLVLLAVVGVETGSSSVTVTSADGTETTWTTDELTMAPQDQGERHEVCEPPPPALPDAGQQPADVESALAAFDAAWQRARDFNEIDEAVIAQYVDDPNGISSARENLMAGQYASAAAGASIVMRDHVFTSPTEMWFRYDLMTPIANFFDRYGIARLDPDGAWRITRETICQDLALAPGNACTPDVERVLPPSAQGDPRFDPSAAPTPMEVPSESATSVLALEE